MDKKINRRNALKTSAATASLMAAPMIVSNNTFGANDTIMMGLIGCGGRGRGVMRMHQHHNTKFVAVCDVAKPRIEAGVRDAQRNHEGKVETYRDFRKLLD
ncbi:hypothetical protein GF373_04515, partial [bacterium]|nr:hypothetical protein [bacterium]